jgi:hypothetical protein
MDLTEKHYKIPIEGRWFLEDLYVFPRAYEQVYFLAYSLLPHEDEQIQERIQYAYSQFPWRGGYSAVNFYNNLKFTTPKKQRPQVISLQYSSPGWIELSLIIGVAVSIEKLIKTIAGSLREANSLYNEIYEGTQKRKLLRIEVKSKELELEKTHADFIMHSVGNMANLLNLQEVDQMTTKTGSPLKTLKILLSLYRRVRTLAEYKRSGKLRL